MECVNCSDDLEGEKLNMEIFISYAEYLEDLILYDALKEYKEGFYVDIGAFDPIDISVTKAFSLRGWKGINVEPLSERHEALVFDRPSDINLKLCVSDSEGEITLFEAGGASTVEQKTLKNIKLNNALSGNSSVRAVTLERLLNENVPQGQPIHFLKIDVEGHEEKVLRGMNFASNRPRIIIIESVVPWKGTPSHDEWEPILLANGYNCSFAYRNNRYYVDQAFPEINFKEVAELLTSYRTFLISSPQDKYRLSYMAIESVFSEHEKIKQFVLKVVRKLYPLVSKYFPTLVK